MNLKKIMAERNISIQEAKTLLRIPSTHDYQLNYSNREWPELRMNEPNTMKAAVGEKEKVKKQSGNYTYAIATYNPKIAEKVHRSPQEDVNMHRKDLHKENNYPQYKRRDKERINSFYKDINVREEEINKEKRGIVFRERERGTMEIEEIADREGNSKEDWKEKVRRFARMLAESMAALKNLKNIT